MKKGVLLLVSMLVLDVALAPSAMAHILSTDWTVVWQDGNDRCLKETATIAEDDGHTMIIIQVGGRGHQSFSIPYVSCTQPLAPKWTPPDLRGRYVLQKYDNAQGKWTDCRVGAWVNPSQDWDTITIGATFSETVCGSGGYRAKAVFQVYYNGAWKPAATSPWTPHVNSPSHTFPT